MWTSWQREGGTSEEYIKLCPPERYVHLLTSFRTLGCGLIGKKVLGGGQV